MGRKGGLRDRRQRSVLFGCFSELLSLQGSLPHEVNVFFARLSLQLQGRSIMNHHHGFDARHRLIVIVFWQGVLERCRLFLAVLWGFLPSILGSNINHFEWFLYSVLGCESSCSNIERCLVVKSGRCKLDLERFLQLLFNKWRFPLPFDLFVEFAHEFLIVKFGFEMVRFCVL